MLINFSTNYRLFIFTDNFMKRELSPM
ncbi:MAG: hypothetical protein RIQ38_2010, partial [Pseudomonadota bacterium]